MPQTLDLSGLTPEQIEQISLMIETFKTINQQRHPLTQKKLSEFNPNPLFFASEILQPFNRTILYGKRA